MFNQHVSTGIKPSILLAEIVDTWLQILDCEDGYEENRLRVRYNNLALIYNSKRGERVIKYAKIQYGRKKQRLRL